jgi:NADH-quinone oxidoreductase subunit C
MPALTHAEQLQQHFGDLVSKPVEFRSEITVSIADPARIAEVCEFAKTRLGFDLIKDISSVDHHGDDPRFELVYELYGLAHRDHLRLKTRVGEGRPELPSVCGVWRGANWHEREIYDMMGIRFAGHPDLRRLIMWEGYPYYPLRKDFPVTGRPTEVPEVAFSETAPIEGGPFLTVPGGRDATQREPRATGIS